MKEARSTYACKYSSLYVLLETSYDDRGIA